MTTNNMYPTIDTNSDDSIVTQLNLIADKFPANTGFIPCVAGATGKKVPMKAEKWQSGRINNLVLREFEPRYTMLGLLLGEKYLAIDCDGVSAIQLLESYNWQLPETLTLSSKPGERQALIFKINRKIEHFEIKTKIPENKKGKGFDSNKEKCEQLEFRSGSEYQIIAGIHPGTKKPYFTNNLAIADLPENIYPFLISKGGQKNEQVEIDTIVPGLTFFITNQNRVDLSGVDSMRNNTGYSLACNLIGTENALQALEIPFTDSAEKLFYQFCENCASGGEWCKSEWDQIWNSATASNPESCYDDETLKELSSFYMPGKPLEENIRILEDKSFVDRSQEIANDIKDLRKSAINNDVAFDLARHIFKKNYRRDPKSRDDHQRVINIVKELEKEEITEEFKADYGKALHSILESKNSSLDYQWLFQGCDILKILDDMIIKENHNSDYISCAFITALSSLMPKKLSYRFNGSGTVPANIFTVFVGGAASGKSIIVDPFIKPLAKLSLLANNIHLERKKEYEKSFENWKSLSKKDKENCYLQLIGEVEIPPGVTESDMRIAVIGEEPLESHPYYMANTSFEALTKASGENDRLGILLAPSELTDLGNTISRIGGKPNAGRTSLDPFISVWNGDPTIVHRSSVERFKADYYRVSILSTIQPERYDQMFDKNDPSGLVSRVLTINIDDNPVEVSSDCQRSQLDIIGRVADVYQKTQTKIVSDFNPDFRNGEIDPTVSAHKLWAHWRMVCENRAKQIKSSNKGFFQWLWRQPAYTARLALVIHAYRYSQGLEADLMELSPESMLRAIAVSKYLCFKAGDIFKCCFTEIVENIDQTDLYNTYDFLGVAKKIMETKNKDHIKVSDIAGHSFVRRKSLIEKYTMEPPHVKKIALKKHEIIKYFQDLHDLGICKWDELAGELKILVNLELATTKGVSIKTKKMIDSTSLLKHLNTVKPEIRYQLATT